MSETKEYVVNLSRLYWGKRSNRAARAVRYLREWIAKKTHAEEIKIDDKINKILWSRGIEKPPRKIKVKVVVEDKKEIKTKTGKEITIPTRVLVTLPEEEKEK